MRIFYISALLVAMALTGCNGESNNANWRANINANSNANQPVVNAQPIQPRGVVESGFTPCNPYYPLAPGSLAVYSISYSSGLVANARVIVEKSEENGNTVYTETTQIIDTSGGANKLSTSSKKYVCKDGNVVLLSEKGSNKVEGNENQTETRYQDDAAFLLALSSLKPGASWSYKFNRVLQAPGQAPINLEPMTVAFTAQDTEEVSVPAGTFNALKVNQKLKENEVSDYYVRGLGLVKRASKEGTTWILKEYSGLAPSQ